MEKQKNSSTIKKTIFFVICAFLVIGTLAGKNLKYITDWSTSELVGFNIWSLIAIFGGAYLIYLGVKIINRL